MWLPVQVLHRETDQSNSALLIKELSIMLMVIEEAITDWSTPDTHLSFVMFSLVFSIFVITCSLNHCFMLICKIYSIAHFKTLLNRFLFISVLKPATNPEKYLRMNVFVPHTTFFYLLEQGSRLCGLYKKPARKCFYLVSVWDRHWKCGSDACFKVPLMKVAKSWACTKIQGCLNGDELT